MTRPTEGGCLVLALRGPAHDLACLHHETGLHRLQRVPEQERRGRIHSSTVSVAVLDAATPEVRPEWRPEDCDIAWFSGSGAGGQHRNKHANCARITHRPTGLVRVAQARSRVQSQMEAMATLRAAVEDLQLAHRQEGLQHVRSSQIGLTGHGERARIWAFQRGWVEDQRSQRQMPMKEALRGHVDRLWPEQARGAGAGLAASEERK